MGYSGAEGKLIHEKNQKQKISWHCPFNLCTNSRKGFTSFVDTCDPQDRLELTPTRSRGELALLKWKEHLIFADSKSTGGFFLFADKTHNRPLHKNT
jgi:hypothetical protein